jgi:hypothetical protein
VSFGEREGDVLATVDEVKMITSALDKNVLSYQVPSIESLCEGNTANIPYIGYRETINYLWNLVRIHSKS